ncbi:hypothetical protein H0G86_007637 [Trichoderma simmonsii]|uniref:Uncharacterized protein n=1 Tax=Trichoderma simmonsii TaxID=1491479 RepID=A0A8G0LEE5_9HYPO|nr:hypothetical protein H0G86_007637 [Trichoderma simmonsii]
MIFYKANEFQFPRSRDCLTYVAAITPSRRNAIRSITLSLGAHYNRSDAKKGKPGDRLRAIAKLCPNLRVLRYDRFFYRSDSLTDWLTMLAETMEPVVASLPLLKEVHIRGSNDGYTWLTCNMTLEKIWLDLFKSTPQGSVSIRDRGELLERRLFSLWDKIVGNEAVSMA